jgi:hypothetical protein
VDKNTEPTDLVIEVDMLVSERDVSAEELRLIEGHLDDLLKQLLAEAGEE